MQCLSILGGQLAPNPWGYPRAYNQCRVFCEKFRSVYVVKGVLWSLLTDLFLKRRWNEITKKRYAKGTSSIKINNSISQNLNDDIEDGKHESVNTNGEMYFNR